MYSDEIADMSELLAKRRNVQATEVWAWNFDLEFGRMLQAVSVAEAICASSSIEGKISDDLSGGHVFSHEGVGGGTIIAVDTEFPGFARDMPRQGSREEQYKAMRDSVDVLQPIQLGLAVAVNGCLLGAWNFNMHFDLTKDLHTQEAVIILSTGGVDFQRHAAEGVDAVLLGRSLANSPLVRIRGDASEGAATKRFPVGRPQWITYAGFYDLGYLVKLLTNDLLPRDASGFDAALAKLCPTRCELENHLPSGSFQSMLEMYSVERRSIVETRGSDALAMLDLFFRAVLGVTPVEVAPLSLDATTNHASAVFVDSQQTYLGSYTSSASIASGTAFFANEQAERDSQAEHDASIALWGMSARVCMGAASAKVQPATVEHGGTRMRRTVGKRRGRANLLAQCEPTTGVAMWAAKARERARALASTGKNGSGDGTRASSNKVQGRTCAESLVKKEVQGSIGGHFGSGKADIAAVAATVFRPPPGLSISHFAPAAAA